jgi:hypothetical protein
MEDSVKLAVKNFAKQQVSTAVSQAECHKGYYAILFREIECLETQLQHRTRAYEQEQLAHGKLSIHCDKQHKRILELETPAHDRS